jgi:dihydrofolate synthase / folylpolyglutamate synthase
MAAVGYPALLARLDSLRSLGVDFGLERVRQALAALRSPEQRLPAVQIAGTNGKGSTAAMAEAILRAAGWRTGLYTSPHLCRFTERIQIAGTEVDGDRLARLDAAIVATGVPLTYFEVATVLAFRVMAEEQVEIGVLETGLGGRLDAVTVCAPLATAITSIGWDHMDFLGSSLASIAREKAGILKAGVPCFLARVPAEADAVIDEVARAVGAPLLRFGRELDIEPDLPAPALAGAHQRANAALAVALAREVARRQGRALPTEAIAAGLTGVRWPARLERVETPAGEVLLDCAHNPEGAEVLAAALPKIQTTTAGERRLVLVISVVAGKDLGGVLRPLLPLFPEVIATRSRNPRALPPSELAAAVEAFSHAAGAMAPRTHVIDDARDAIVESRRLAGSTGLVVVAGSIFLAAEARAALLGERVDPQPVSDPL